MKINYIKPPKPIKTTGTVSYINDYVMRNKVTQFLYTFRDYQFQRIYILLYYILTSIHVMIL